MSTKASLFLTNDANEHCYFDASQPVYKDGEYLDDTITLELNKKNIRIIANDDEYLIIEIDPGSEIFELIKMMRN